MRVRCPHCSQPIELVPDLESKSIVCPSCGSEIGLLSADDPTATLAAPELPALQHFRLIDEVGIGQFGCVWKAQDTELNRFVAIKVPHKRSGTRLESAFFLREARSAAKLSHPNIVSVFEIGLSNETLFIVSEFIDGPTMKVWKDLRKPAPYEAARVCMKVAQALDYAHKQGIVHRDLKPSNIILDDKDEPHITDFGLAKQDGAEATIAITGQIIGTPAYMAPEQVRDGHRADARSDIYSLGVTLYELLVGKRPFQGSRRVLLQRVLYDSPPPPRTIKPEVPKDLQTICMKAMEKSPTDRYATAGEMAEDLRRFLTGESIRARPTPIMLRAARWARRRPAIVSTAVLALLVLVLLPLAFLRRPPAAATPSQRPPVAGPRVRLTTDPPGANIVLIPLNPAQGRWDPSAAFHAGHSPVRLRLRPGWYLVEAYSDDGQMFHEVYRRVPEADEPEMGSVFQMTRWTRDADGTVELTSIRLFRQDHVVRKMVHVRGGTFPTRVLHHSGPIDATIPDFYVDETELTYATLMGARYQPPTTPEQLGLTLDCPVVNLTWMFAANYAERLGKRLLLDTEFSYLLTAGGTQPAPTGARSGDACKSALAGPGPVRDPAWDRLEWDRLSRPVIGIRSHVAEWVDGWGSAVRYGPFRRVARGSPTGDPEKGRWQAHRETLRLILDRDSTSPQIGFRCARSRNPRITPSDFPRFRQAEP